MQMTPQQFDALCDLIDACVQRHKDVNGEQNYEHARQVTRDLFVGFDRCGGCGADHPDQRCIGCFHVFERT